MSPVLIKVANAIVQSNLEAEVRLVLGDKRDENNCLLFDLWKEGTLEKALWPELHASTDMGWQGRSSGNLYNSLSGHALFVGMLTRKPIAWSVLAKSCSFCKGWHHTHMEGEDPPDHECVKNHDGSSGSMGPIAMLNMCKGLVDNSHVIPKHIVTDDDCSIKAKLRWSNADYMINNNTTEKPKIINKNGNKVERPDKGGVPAHMPEPLFLADPNHRKKTLKGALCGMVKKTVEKRCALTRCDCVRLATNFACMARSLKHKTTDDEIVTAGKAVLEHHFDNHEFCGGWCRCKDTQDEEKKRKKHYRCKTRDAKLHAVLKGLLV